MQDDNAQTIRRIPAHIGWIIAAASLHPIGSECATALPCREADEGKRCEGTIVVRSSQVPPIIEWHCHKCKFGRVVKGWQGSDWDLRPQPSAQPAPPLIEVLITGAHYALLRQFGPDVAVARATVHPSSLIALHGTRRDFDVLQTHVALTASHPEASARRRALLAAIWEHIEEAVTA